MTDPRLSHIIIKPGRMYQTSYGLDGFDLPDTIIEEYFIYYNKDMIGRFWISNEYKASIQLSVPLDIDILHYILEQVKVREFRKVDV